MLKFARVAGMRHRADAVPPNAIRDAAHISALTGVRAFAALWVFFYHAWLAADHPRLLLPFSRAVLDVTPVVAFGWLGVDLFFVLSGFLLTRQAFGKVARADVAGERCSGWGETYWSFLRRRILRVYPAYYFTISILLILAALHIYRELPEKADLALHLLMFHNVVERYIDTIDGVFWSIPFEWQFYLVFPILFVALRRVPPVAFLHRLRAARVRDQGVLPDCSACRGCTRRIRPEPTISMRWGSRDRCGSRRRSVCCCWVSPENGIPACTCSATARPCGLVSSATAFTWFTFPCSIC